MVNQGGGDLNFFQKSLLIRAYLNRIQPSLNFSEIILTASLQSQLGTGGGGQFWIVKFIILLWEMSIWNTTFQRFLLYFNKGVTRMSSDHLLFYELEITLSHLYERVLKARWKGCKNCKLCSRPSDTKKINFWQKPLVLNFKLVFLKSGFWILLAQLMTKI